MFDSNQNIVGQQHKTTVNVDANSEGNVMIPLPPLDESTRRVEFTCVKPAKIKISRPQNVEIGRNDKPTQLVGHQIVKPHNPPHITNIIDQTFFGIYHNKNRTKTISVDISD